MSNQAVSAMESQQISGSLHASAVIRSLRKRSSALPPANQSVRRADEALLSVLCARKADHSSRVRHGFGGW